MHTILYLGPTTDLDYERELLREWGKQGSVQLATCLSLSARQQFAATGTDGPLAVAAPQADPLRGVDAVVVERGTLDADVLREHRDKLTCVVLLDDKNARADVAAATEYCIWVTRASNRSLFTKLPFTSSAPGHSARRHALQDALAGISGERPSGRINEL